MVAHFRDQHAGMIRLAEAILATADSTGSGEVLRRLRLDFARAVIEHCSEEGAAVSRAVARGRLCGDQVAERTKVVMRWRAELALCNSEWPTSRIARDPRDFVKRFKPLVDGLRREAEIEEAEIHPALEAAA